MDRLGKRAAGPFGREDPRDGGMSLFHIQQMERFLPKRVFQNIKALREGREAFDPNLAKAVAAALQEWALREGATHFKYLVHPITSGHFSSSERLEGLNGEKLLRGEVLLKGWKERESITAYATWDPTSDPFLLDSTLCIPSLLFSAQGRALDHRIPLLRSEEKLIDAFHRLIRLQNLSVARVIPMLAIDQEFCLVDRSLYEKRPDLLSLGKMVFGREEKEELFSSNERIEELLRAVEAKALLLGIPVQRWQKGRAPSHYRVTMGPVRALLAARNNLLLLSLFEQMALDAGFALLVQDLPFAPLNGSCKVLHWSFASETEKEIPGAPLFPLTLLAAVAGALADRSELLRSHFTSWEALRHTETNVPLLFSMALGEELEGWINRLIHERTFPENIVREIPIPEKEEMNSDKRAAFLTYARGVFTLRGVSSSVDPALPLSLFHAMVASELHRIADEFEKEGPLSLKRPFHSFFAGEKTQISSAASPFSSWLAPKEEDLLQGILSREEIRERYEVETERYARSILKEAHLMVHVFRTQIVPHIAKVSAAEKLIEDLKESMQELEKIEAQTENFGWEARADVFRELLEPRIRRALLQFAELESSVDASLWPFPKFQELFWVHS
ncbi:MAG: glutamine synthetase III [Verrucomicrobiota bacterium]|nr:glutamine synthetase III [Verrucomicrobiota bacterium]